jgi:hypothetical protein
MSTHARGADLLFTSSYVMMMTMMCNMQVGFSLSRWCVFNNLDAHANVHILSDEYVCVRALRRSEEKVEFNWKF